MDVSVKAHLCVVSIPKCCILITIIAISFTLNVLTFLPPCPSSLPFHSDSSPSSPNHFPISCSEPTIKSMQIKLHNKDSISNSALFGLHREGKSRSLNIDFHTALLVISAFVLISGDIIALPFTHHCLSLLKSKCLLW